MSSSSRIPDNRIYAPTYIVGHEAKYVRLTETANAFCAEQSESPVLKITFDTPTLVIGVQMLGHPTEQDWVTKFKVYVAEEWLDLPGNTDPVKVVGRPFFNDQSSTTFKIRPSESNGRKCMRIELFGINDGKCVSLSGCSDVQAIAAYFRILLEYYQLDQLV